MGNVEGVAIFATFAISGGQPEPLTLPNQGLERRIASTLSRL
jgi:hypothetical protein